ncbi:MAG: excinuclease ABC subunit UvrC [Bacteroidales bacterium]|nr:excinuclease ABC subunit UvrC [Bacteroidales bacterium]
MEIRDKIKLLPHSPGVYRYYDSEGTVIYVGKAKDLRKRVAQYFVAPERLNTKTRILVSKIADMQYSVVDSEADALLLENNLIKQYKPHYNILLKDSKTYPWICVTSEPYPRVFLTRRVEKDGSQYFGPYSSVLHARALLDLFYETWPLRSCRHKIDADTVLRGKIRPCLDMQIGKCRGCCVGKVGTEEYGSWISAIVSLLKGNVGEVIRALEVRMKEASAELDFETAQLCKERAERLRGHYSRSIISAARELEADVFSLVSEEDIRIPGGSPPPESWGNFLRIRGGAVVQSLNLGFKARIEESRESVLSAFIAEIESKFGALSREIIVPFLPDVEIPGVKFTVPERGDKLSLLGLSAKNAWEYRLGTLRQREHSDPDAFRRSVLEELRTALAMPVLPEHMECFDNSNIQGTNPVASCVVFRGGVPSKKDYRKFKIKTVVGANDYASMKEVVNRRYSRMLAEAPDDLPQLVVIDGGKGQLEFAWQALCELGIQDRLTVVGLAKRLEEVIRVGDPYPLFLDRNSQALKLLQQIRDEAHRFGITFHRSLRSKAAVHSALDDIPGVGPKTAERLLLHFGSVARIAAANPQELINFVGPKLSERIRTALASEANTQ